MDDPVVWIVIALVALALLAVLAYLLQKRKKERAHAHAETLRHQAVQHSTTVNQSQLDAQKAQAEAELARAQAREAELRAEEASRASAQTEAHQEHVVREADRIDPHVDHRSDDYTPETPEPGRHRQPE